MAIERDEKNPNITIVHTAQGDIRFDFGTAGKKIDVTMEKVSPFEAFDEAGRKKLEALMDKTFNPPPESTQTLKDLQAKFNETVIATQSGKPLEVGTTEKLTSQDTGGGGLIRKLNSEDVALGINVTEVEKTPYKDNMGGKHFMHGEDILRHELVHYVDKASDPGHVSTGPDDPTNDPLFKERRAVWVVNQFQLADTPQRAQRISYSTPDFDFDHGLAGADGKVAGKNIPGAEKGYPEPSPANHRMYPWSKHAEATSATEVADGKENLPLPGLAAHARNVELHLSESGRPAAALDIINEQIAMRMNAQQKNGVDLPATIYEKQEKVVEVEHKQQEPVRAA